MVTAYSKRATHRLMACSFAIRSRRNCAAQCVSSEQCLSARDASSKGQNPKRESWLRRGGVV
eukprot:6473806-Karenia_brevis.AAC.1